MLVQARVRELAARDWDLGSIEARYRTLLAGGHRPAAARPAAVVARQGRHPGPGAAPGRGVRIPRATTEPAALLFP